MRLLSILLVVLAFFTAGWSDAGAQTEDAKGQQTILIADVAVFDGSQMLEPRNVLIVGGKIADITYMGSPPDGADIVDGKGKTLLPGLIDSHVHAYTGGDDALLYGVTTQVDMFSPPPATAAIRSAMKGGGNYESADILTAGHLATVPDGHGTQFGVNVPTITTPDAADQWVADRLAEGSDFIKIVIEPGSSFGRPLPTLDGPTVKAIVEAAHKRNVLAVAHAQDMASAILAIESGVDGLVHLFTDAQGGATFADLAKKAGIFVTPTHVVMEGFFGRAGSAAMIANSEFGNLLAENNRNSLSTTFGGDRSARLDAIMAGNVAALRDAGVPILAGSDAANPGVWYGLSMHRELELLVNDGLTPLEALIAATSAPAKAYGFDDRGFIANGMTADLLLVEGDPSADITATRNIVEIWKSGRAVSPLRDARLARLSESSESKGPNNGLKLPDDGVIARFTEQSGSANITSPFGAGWSVSTDAIIGGQSTANLALGVPGPDDQASLDIDGNVAKGAFGQWAGIAFAPGLQPFAPADLSSARAISFQVKGVGSGFALIVFHEKGGQQPLFKPFDVGSEWGEVQIDFADVDGFEPSGTTLFVIAAVEPGAHQWSLANIKLVANNDGRAGLD